MTRRRLFLILVVLVVGSLAFAAFLRALRFYPNPWYYLPWMGLAALCADAAVA